MELGSGASDGESEGLKWTNRTTQIHTTTVATRIKGHLALPMFKITHLTTMNFDGIGTQYLVLVFVYVVIIAYAIYE